MCIGTHMCPYKISQWPGAGQVVWSGWQENLRIYVPGQDCDYKHELFLCGFSGWNWVSCLQSKYFINWPLHSRPRTTLLKKKSIIIFYNPIKMYF